MRSWIKGWSNGLQECTKVERRQLITKLITTLIPFLDKREEWTGWNYEIQTQSVTTLALDGGEA